MNFMLSCRQPLTVLKGVSEIKVDYKDIYRIADFATSDWQCKAAVNIYIPNKTEIDWQKINNYKDVLNLVFALEDTVQSDEVKAHGFNKYFWSYPATSYYELRGLLDLGVSQVLFDAPLFFCLPTVKSICKNVNIYCAGKYEKTMQKLIRGIKYHKQKELAFYQAKFMSEYFNKLNLSKNYQVIPVPLYKERQKKRGYNHMELVAEEFCRLTGYTLNTDFILRIKDTKPQYKLNPKERAENLAGAFAIAKGVKIGGKILLMDDICTTGSTFTEMVKTLKNHGINDIVCFATTAVKFQMILADFSKYIQSRQQEILDNEKSAVRILTDWLRENLSHCAENNVQKILHTEIMCAQNEYNEFLIIGKSDSGRVLINALYNYALSYEHYILAKNIPDTLELKNGK